MWSQEIPQDQSTKANKPVLSLRANDKGTRPSNIEGRSWFSGRKRGFEFLQIVLTPREKENDQWQGDLRLDSVDFPMAG